MIGEEDQIEQSFVYKDREYDLIKIIEGLKFFKDFDSQFIIITTESHHIVGTILLKGDKNLDNAYMEIGTFKDIPL